MPGRAPAGFAFLQHHFELPSEFIRNGIAVGTAIARRVCFDRFADGDDRVQRRMRAGGVGQIFLVTLDGLQQTLGGWRIGKVVARVTMQLLGEIQVRELPPAAGVLFLGEFAMDHVRQDGGAQTLDPRHRIRFAASAVPLPFEWFQEVIEQTRKPLHHDTGLRCAEVFDFLEREQRVSGFNYPIAEEQMALRLPGQSGFDFLQDRCDGCSGVAFEEVADKNRMHHHVAG